MTRVEAIMFLLRRLNDAETRKILIEGTFHCKSYAREEVEAYDMEIAALREQEERSKGCLYCDGTEGDLYFHEGACSQMNDVVYIANNQINCDFGCKAWGAFAIKFCPICGRKLEVDDQ